MERTLEPELMLDQEQVDAYARADFSEPNSRFCDTLLTRFDLPQAARVVDLGCGPADIALRLSQARPDLTIDAVDGSEAMIARARTELAAASAGAQLRLWCERLPARSLPDASFHAVLSNSLLHHLERPELLWQELKRLGRPDAAVLVMDLRRPDSAEAARALVHTYAADEAPILRRDFEASLHAAFTPTEVEAQLKAAGLAQLRVEQPSDRHLWVVGRL
ncbi:MAG: class I SAM-dependent methyltransferase [Myxococcales bacterium]|nr:class I SAM-dependent methyltransferase [Myxococcales bacterium]